jgi:TetR/AcrR family transcriptional regulator, mexJK operon transcriptional repressor
MTAALPARSARKRESIMSAGRDLFLTHGYQGTSVDQIAAAAAVSKQTVYKHFGDKRELLLAIVGMVVDGAVQPFVERVAALGDSAQTALDLEAALVTLGSDYLGSVLAEPVVQLRRLVVGEANGLPELARRYYDQAPARTLTALAEAFATLHRRGLLDVPESTLAAEHFAFLVVGRSIDRALFFGGPATLSELDVAEHVRAAVRVFLAGYRVGRR